MCGPPFGRSQWTSRAAPSSSPGRCSGPPARRRRRTCAAAKQLRANTAGSCSRTPLRCCGSFKTAAPRQQVDSIPGAQKSAPNTPAAQPGGLGLRQRHLDDGRESLAVRQCLAEARRLAVAQLAAQVLAPQLEPARLRGLGGSSLAVRRSAVLRLRTSLYVVFNEVLMVRSAEIVEQTQVDSRVNHLGFPTCSWF